MLYEIPEIPTMYVCADIDIMISKLSEQPWDWRVTSWGRPDDIVDRSVNQSTSWREQPAHRPSAEHVLPTRRLTYRLTLRHERRTNGMGTMPTY